MPELEERLIWSVGISMYLTLPQPMKGRTRQSAIPELRPVNQLNPSKTLAKNGTVESRALTMRSRPTGTRKMKVPALEHPLGTTALWMKAMYGK